MSCNGQLDRCRNNNEEKKSLANDLNLWLTNKYLLRRYNERMMPARQKPSKKRRTLNMGTLTEKATLRPNTSMDSTDMISIGWRPNLESKVTIISFYFIYSFLLWSNISKTQFWGENFLPVIKDTKHQVAKAGSNQQSKFCYVDFPRWVTHQTPLSRQISTGIISEKVVYWVKDSKVKDWCLFYFILRIKTILAYTLRIFLGVTEFTS